MFWAFKVARASSVSRDCAPPLRAAHSHGKPLFLLFFFALCCCITPPFKLFSCCSHGTMTAALQALPFVTAMDGGSVCVACVLLCVCVRAVLGTQPRAMQLFFESRRSAAQPQKQYGYTAAVQLQRHNSSLRFTLLPCDRHGGVMLSRRCDHDHIFTSNTHRRTSYITHT